MGKEHDVALLLFERPGFQITPYVRPICLWDEDFNFTLISGVSGEVKYKKLNFY